MANLPTDNVPGDPTPEPELVLLIRDLLFSSKATGAARSAGVPFKVVRDTGKLADVGGRRLIADLSQDDALDACVAWKERTGGTVVGFLPHVAGDLISAARAMGVDRVMSNGALSANIDRVVRGE